MKQEALKLNKAGFKVIPTTSPSLPNGKRPMCKSWKKYQEKQTQEDVEELFSQKNIGGMALLTADGLEVIDIDLKYSLDDNLLPKLLDKIMDAVGIETYEKLILSQTISGGYHIIYRTNIPQGNQKLAQRYTIESEKKNQHDKIRVLLETRGIGGYILIPPTKGYQYDNKETHSILNVSLITDDERNGIINACKLFDQTTEHYKNVAPTPVQIQGKNKTTIEAFNEAHNPKEFIEQHGWQFKYQTGENLFYVRPGKSLKEGIGGSYHTGLNLFYAYTSSTEFEQNKAYNAFQVYSVLEHGGDMSKAASILYKNGYGDRLSKNRDSYYDTIMNLSDETANKSDKLSVWDKVYPLKFDINDVPDEIEHILYFQNDSFEDPIPLAAFGDMIMISGAAKSRKSALSNSIAAALLSGSNEVLKFSGNAKGRDIVVIDTEQNINDFYKSIKQIYSQAGVKPGTNPKNFHAFPICHLTINERLQFVQKVFEEIDDVGVLVLDGIVDICEDYNDQKGSRALVNFLMNITRENNTMFIPVLHTARSTGSARGHLGGELQNKCKITIRVTKNKDAKDSTVEFPFIRGSKDPDEFRFTHDENGNLVTL
jgi:hypothetical protein